MCALHLGLLYGQYVGSSEFDSKHHREAQKWVRDGDSGNMAL